MESEFKRTFEFPKVATYGKRKINAVDIEVSLHYIEKPKLTTNLELIPHYVEFTASGNVWNASHSDIFSGGQNLDVIAQYYPHNHDVQRIVRVWRRCHLNGMKPGTRAQMDYLAEQKAAIKETMAKHGFRFEPEDNDYGYHFDADGKRKWGTSQAYFNFAGYGTTYEWECETLKAVNLFEIEYPETLSNAVANRVTGDALTGGTYRYGHAWLVEKLTAEDWRDIAEIFKSDRVALVDWLRSIGLVHKLAGEPILVNDEV